MIQQHQPRAAWDGANSSSAAAAGMNARFMRADVAQRRQGNIWSYNVYSFCFPVPVNSRI